MSLSHLFWLVYFVVAILGFVFERPYSARSGVALALFILIGILGWRVFGSAITGTM